MHNPPQPTHSTNKSNNKPAEASKSQLQTPLEIPQIQSTNSASTTCRWCWFNGDGGRIRSQCRVRCFFFLSHLHMCENRKLMPLRNMNPVYYPVTYQLSHAPDWWDKRDIAGRGPSFVPTDQRRVAGTQLLHTLSASAKDWNGSLICLFLPTNTRAAR